MSNRNIPCSITAFAIGKMWLSAIFFFISGATCFTIPSDPSNSCSHPDCLEFATTLINSLNRSVNPCENFFEFACGGWNQHHPSQARQQNSVIFQQMQKITKRVQAILETDPVEGEDALNKARYSYKTCMKYDYSTFEKEFLDITQDLGGWPLVEGTSWNFQQYFPSLNEVFPILAKLRLIKPDGALFSVEIRTNHEDTTSSKLVLLPPKESPLSQFLIQKDRAFVTSELRERAKTFNPKVNDQQLEQDVSDMFRLDDILHSTLTASKNKKDKSQYSKLEYTITELEELTKVKWSEFFSVLFQGSAEVKATTAIELPDYSTIHYLSSIIQQISGPNFNSRTVINYELMGLLNYLENVSNILKKGTGIITLNTMFNPLNHDTETFINLTQPIATTRGEVCANTMSQTYAYAIAWKYVLQYEELQKQRQVAKEITENIFNVFGERLRNIEWMDETTRSAALLKAHHMKGYYVYPDWNENLADVNEFYRYMNSANNFLRDFINMQQFIIELNLKHYGTTAWKYLEKWIFPPLVTNAYYSFRDNAMRILDGIMQKPIFNVNRLRAMNYGSLGSIIGHEITHGFDQTGVQYDIYGRRNPWMSQSSMIQFNQHAQCFKDQYSQYVMTPKDLPGSSEYHINGIKTANENIADNGGLHQAYKAYKKKLDEVGPEKVPDSLKEFSSDQLFFLSFAHTWCGNYGEYQKWPEFLASDVHCVNKFRVIGSLSNFDEFHKHFGCFPGDKMVNLKQCTIW